MPEPTAELAAKLRRRSAAVGTAGWENEPQEHRADAIADLLEIDSPLSDGAGGLPSLGPLFSACASTGAVDPDEFVVGGEMPRRPSTISSIPGRISPSRTGNWTRGDSRPEVEYLARNFNEKKFSGHDIGLHTGPSCSWDHNGQVDAAYHEPETVTERRRRELIEKSGGVFVGRGQRDMMPMPARRRSSAHHAFNPGGGSHYTAGGHTFEEQPLRTTSTLFEDEMVGRESSRAASRGDSDSPRPLLQCQSSRRYPTPQRIDLSTPVQNVNMVVHGSATSSVGAPSRSVRRDVGATSTSLPVSSSAWRGPQPRRQHQHPPNDVFPVPKNRSDVEIDPNRLQKMGEKQRGCMNRMNACDVGQLMSDSMCPGGGLFYGRAANESLTEHEINLG